MQTSRAACDVAAFFSKCQIELLVLQTNIKGHGLLPDSNVEVSAMLLLSMENDVAGQSP